MVGVKIFDLRTYPTEFDLDRRFALADAENFAARQDAALRAHPFADALKEL